MKSSKHGFDREDGKEGKFIYWRPRRTPTYRRRAPEEPYPNAPLEECSVYYFWFQFLLRNEDFRLYCETGKGDFEEIYEHWGNIYCEHDFMDWWDRHKALFREPPSRKLSLAEEVFNDGLTMTVNVPLELDSKYVISRFKRLLKQEKSKYKKKNRKIVSEALYPVHQKPVLKTLHKCLKAYDAYVNSNGEPQWQLADKLGFEVSQATKMDLSLTFQTKSEAIQQKRMGDITRRRKVNLFQRYKNAGERYVYWAGKGKFPCSEPIPTGSEAK